MVAHPAALQWHNLQSLVEVGVDKNTTFPAPLMTTIGDLSVFRQRKTRLADEALKAGEPRVGCPVPPTLRGEQPEAVPGRAAARQGRTLRSRGRQALLQRVAR